MGVDINNKVCVRCGKADGNIKYYIIADNLEEPRPMHEKCFKEFQKECLIAYCKEIK